MVKIRVFDTEGVGLNYKTEKLHNFCYTEDGENFSYTTSYDEMKQWLAEPNVLWVGHFAIGHDMPALNTILGTDLTYQKFWDSMYMSWALFPDRPKHGLEYLGVEHGVAKVKVEEHQWEEGNPELMRKRVIEDVKINWLEFVKQKKRLLEIYGADDLNEEIFRYVRYIGFKGDCLRQQELNPLKIDREKAQKHYDELLTIVEEKKEALSKAMPKVPIMNYHNKPKKPYKADGSLSALGERWYDTLKRLGLPDDTVGPVGEVVGYEDGNPQSDPQLKEYLFSLGWQPCTYKFLRDKVSGDEKKIPQVRYFSQNDPRKGELTESIKALVEKEPALEHLDGLTVAKHRLSIFKAFLDYSDEDGYCAATAGGFTNTLRLQHRNPFVNLPKADGEVPWGVEIRGCIIAPEGYEMCGSDVVSLEATTKRHYMYPYDPEYAEAMGVEGFDEHLDLAKYDGKLTQEEIDEKGKSDPTIKHIRKQYKATNYSAVYGIGSPKLARELFTTKVKAQGLLDAYWKRNWSVKKVAEDQYVKMLKDGTMWIKNPVSGFYYSLRYEKDRFSTLNQGTGVFIFDSWLMRCRRMGVVVPFQYHDELMTLRKIDTQTREDVEGKLHKAMSEVNESLKLNVNVRVDVQWGNDYASVH